MENQLERGQGAAKETELQAHDARRDKETLQSQLDEKKDETFKV